MYVLSKNIKTINFFLVKFSIFLNEKNHCICMGVFRNFIAKIAYDSMSSDGRIRHTETNTVKCA